MRVTKRDGTLELVSFDKVLQRHRDICLPGDSAGWAKGLKHLKNVDFYKIALEVVSGLFDCIPTSQLDGLAANIACPRSDLHPEYDEFAARISVDSYHKDNIHHVVNHFGFNSDFGTDPRTQTTAKLFNHVSQILFNNTEEGGQQAPLISPEVAAFVKLHAERFEKMMKYDRDYDFDYMGFKVLHNTYLMKAWIRGRDGKKTWTQIERPQHMIMRIAIGIHLPESGRSWDKERFAPDTEILAQIREKYPDLNKYISQSTINKIAAEAQNNSIDWSTVCELFAAHHIDLANLQTILDNGINHNSWEILEYRERRRFEEKSEEWTNNKFAKIAETYEYMSRQCFTHATPTLFNSGTLRPQLSSCYLMSMPSDSLEGIARYWHNAAQISKFAGGLASSVHNIRPQGAYIRGTNGTSNGLRPLLKVTNEISGYIDQGGNKRPGAHAIYLEPWHGDIFAFLDLKKQRGNERERARALFYAIWMNDEFMRRFERENALARDDPKSNPQEWYLVDSNKCPQLINSHDAALAVGWISDEEVEARRSEFEFTYWYRRCIREGKYMRRVSAREIWREICNLIVETGVPYIVMKDSSNRKSNQKNLGTIRSSNLCTEIIEYSAPDEIAVCNLASICLPKFVKPCDGVGCDEAPRRRCYETSLTPNDPTTSRRLHFCWEEVEAVDRVMTRNLDKVIDINFYPVPETENSNRRHRPMGKGVQGLADLFSMLRLPFASQEANRLNFYIFECLYHTSLTESIKMGRESGSYETFRGSPASQGKLQFDLWREEQAPQGRDPLQFPLHYGDWQNIRDQLSAPDGCLRNSLFVAPMPTGTTSTIMGNSPCFEPRSSIIFKRRNGAGEFVVSDKNFILDMISLGCWSPDLPDKIKNDRRGSVADIPEVPRVIAEIYPTVWDIDPRALVDCALVRAPFIDQSQSFSQFEDRPTVASLTRRHFYAWRRGIKTSSYYTRRLPPADAKKVQIESTATPYKLEKVDEGSDQACPLDGSCRTCSA
jgi:ribonucleoside-diphosphate reductase alpha subunit